MDDTVRNNRALGRYELEVDGHVAIAQYKRADGVITFTHTEVPKELGGRGVGSRLAQGALALARAEGHRVVAKCPFIAGYLAKHPEFADLVAAEGPPA
jgi:predicted GNAT family acetyltransferase